MREFARRAGDERRRRGVPRHRRARPGRCTTPATTCSSSRPASDLSGAGASIGPLHRSEPIPVAEHHWAEVPDVPVLAIERPARDRRLPRVPRRLRRASRHRRVRASTRARTPVTSILHSGTVGAALTAAGLGRPRARGQREVERDGLLAGRPRRSSRSRRSSGSAPVTGAPRDPQPERAEPPARRGPRRPGGRRWRRTASSGSRRRTSAPATCASSSRGRRSSPTPRPTRRSSSPGTRRSPRCSASSPPRSRERPKSVENALGARVARLRRH